MARLCVCLLALAMLASVKGATREYFIAAQDILWNYVPGGGQFKDRDGETFAETWTKQNADRIGPVYRKAAYFQYTDASFSEEIPKHPQLGLLGPLIRAEVGDVIVINFFNNATGNFSIHPHAVFYQKMNEGALYLDGTSGQDKKDDAVPPGKIVTQIWHVTENNSPTDSDPNCLPWVYHSHTDAVKDPAAGLLGVIVTCKKGVLDSYGVRKDVDVDLPLVAFNWDENLSWYIDENIQRYCGDPARCVQLQQSADPAFVDSNRRRSLNGLQFSTMFGLQACAGSRVVFYNIGFGNEVDVHGIHFHGQDMKYQHTRGDTVSVYSATFVAAETTPQVPGDWLVTDVTENNERAGISAIFSVFDCDAAGYKKSETYGIVRRYFLTVEETTWNYAPSGKDLRTGQDLTGPSASSSYMESDKGHSFYQYESPNYQAPSQSQYPGPSQIQLTYTKARFFQYTNGAFKYRVASPEHLGLVGPVLKAEVGDTLVVSLNNTIPFPVSFLPHGLRYDSSEEFIAGTSYPGGIVGQGEVHNYTFYVPTDLLDGSYLPCRNFLYSSTYDIAKDQNAGLVGVLLVCRKGYFSSKEYKPKQIFLLLSIIDESNSLYTKPNTSVPDLKAAINGYIFGNLPQLDVCTNENVIWYVMSVGSALDVHTLTFDGNTFDENGNNRDARYLTPGDTAALSMNPDNPGRWMLYSHSNLARENGMFAFYNVKTCTSSYTSKDQSGYTSKDQLGYTSKDQSGYTSKDQSGYGKTRDYFVAADELLWDYAPLPRSIVTGEDLFNPNTEGHIFVRQDPYFIGKVHKKAVYREYTDDSFKLIKPGENRDILGPVMVAEVGDTIKITFKNNARIPFSIHAHGLKTSQKDSGVNYGDAAAVAPGQVYQYVWQVPERSGPGRNDPNCIPWVYYSSIDPLKDTNSGLIGGLVVCRKGILDSYSRRKDVDRELFTLFTVMNENDSWYLEENIKMFAPARLGTNYQNDPRFVESNKKHTINGRIYGNNQNLIMIYNQKVAWNVMGLGTEIDLHTVHFHGHTYVQRSIDHKDDVVQIFPGMAEVVEFVADDPGTWLFHCHVLDHIAAGMETYYTVFKPAAAQDSKAY